MDLINRAKNIITNPNQEWNTIAVEAPDTNKIITGYVLPLAGLAAIAAFLGYVLIGVEVLGFRYKGINWGLYQGVSVFVNAICSVFITSLVVDMLAPSFNSEKNFGKSLQLVVYSYTPGWVGGLLAIIPMLGIVGMLFAIYGLYLLYIGIPKLKHTPADKHTSYFVVILIVTIMVYIVVGWILRSVLMGVFNVHYGTDLI